MNRTCFSVLRCHLSLASAVTFLTLNCLSTVAQNSSTNPAPRLLVAWEKPDPRPGGLFDSLKNRLQKVGDMVVRVTSPDVAPENRHLWIISEDGKTKRLLSSEGGVRGPHWGAAGFIAYEVEADTNNDGVIDANDDLQIHVIAAAGGASQSAGKGRSPVWSPDGRHLAFLRDDGIWTYGLDGEVKRLDHSQKGSLIFTDRRSVATATNFWTLDIATQAIQPLLPELQKRYLWLGSISPSGSKLVFHDAMRSDIFVRKLTVLEPETNLTADAFSDFDPTWSPDEKFIVFVSDRPIDGVK